MHNFFYDRYDNDSNIENYFPAWREQSFMKTEHSPLARRTFWTRLGYGMTVLWVFFVLYKTDGDITNPWFDGIFLVPLAFWAIGLAIAKIFFGPKTPPRAPNF